MCSQLSRILAVFSSRSERRKQVKYKYIIEDTLVSRKDSGDDTQQNQRQFYTFLNMKNYEKLVKKC